MLPRPVATHAGAHTRRRNSDVRGAEKQHLLVLDPGEVDVIAWRRFQELATHRGAENLREYLVRSLHRGGREARCREERDPFLYREVVDRRQRNVAEGRQYL